MVGNPTHVATTFEPSAATFIMDPVVIDQPGKSTTCIDTNTLMAKVNSQTDPQKLIELMLKLPAFKERQAEITTYIREKSGGCGSIPGLLQYDMEAAAKLRLLRECIGMLVMGKAEVSKETKPATYSPPDAEPETKVTATIPEGLLEKRRQQDENGRRIGLELSLMTALRDFIREFQESPEAQPAPDLKPALLDLLKDEEIQAALKPIIKATLKEIMA